MSPARAKAKTDRGIRQLEDGLYEVSVAAGRDPVTGTYRRKWQRVRGTLTDARLARAQLLVDAAEGRHDGTNATVADLMDAWLRELERLGRAPSTLRGYRKDVARYIKPRFGATPVRKVTARMIADHLASLQEQGLAPNTVRLVHACLSSAFSQAWRWEWVSKDPTKLVRAPSIANKRPKIPTVAEVAALISAAQTSRVPEMQRAIWIAATTGVRRGEVCGLQIGDFDLDSGRMTVERAISHRTVWTTKNRRERDVALDPLTVAVVQAQADFMRLRAAEGGAALADDAYLFSDDLDGARPWNPDRVSKYFAALAERVDLGHVTFHQLRKFMESRALDAGFSVAQVAARAGHDPSVMLRFYAGGVDEQDRAIGAAVASLLDPGR